MPYLTDSLTGRVVTESILTEGEASLVVTGGACLTIYNNFIITSKNGEARVISTGDIVSDIEEDKARVVIKLKSGAKLIISMDDASYNGPEAMQLTIPGESTIVWN
ncbi:MULTISPECIES: hypothetical protein [Halomonas]|uniref:hypothetical protein n=1 Tax=Halomonas TaxID=2745 RepID=UPI001A906B90|nr:MULTISPECIES: hypothetical protein [Halomonas]MBN8411242.1 hypothetical protein [Halomonas litopenaei]MBY5985382.1 hypothetical protein [Halomonas sp. DP5Y7-2]